MRGIEEIRASLSFVPNVTTGRSGIVMTLIGMVLNLFNMYTDLYLGISYLQDGHGHVREQEHLSKGEKYRDWWYGCITLFLLVLSSSFISLYTACMHYKCNGVFLNRIGVAKPFVYALCTLLHGQLARALMWLKLLVLEVPLLGITSALWAFRDITNFAEVFIQSVPQLYLQCYIILIRRGNLTKLQVIACVSSALSASWGLLSQFHGFTWKFIAFELNLFWFASRAAAIALLASVRKFLPFVFLLGHLLLVLPLWFWQNKIRPFRKKHGENRWQLLITDAFYSIIYAATNTATPLTCKYSFLLSCILGAENVICLILAQKFGYIHRHAEHYKKHTYVNFASHDCKERIFIGSDGKNVTTTAYPGASVVSCDIPFKQWYHYRVCLALSFSLSAIAFAQVLTIHLLKYFGYVSMDALTSDLGHGCSKKAEGRVYCNSPAYVLKNSISKNVNSRISECSVTTVYQCNESEA